MIKIGSRLNLCFKCFHFSQKLLKRSLSNGHVLCNNSILRERSQLIDGKALSQKILNKVKFDVNKWIGLGNRRPHLTVVLIGENAASELYIKNKSKAAKACGISSDLVHCPETISQKELLGIITDLNSDDTVDAILVQLPCPGHINENTLFNKISACKDVDGFGSAHVANLALRENSGIIPCTALAVSQILQEIDLPRNGLDTVIVGCSKYIGLPIFLSLYSPSQIGALSVLNLTITVCHEHTSMSSLEHFLQRSDLIISAVGKPGLIRGELIKPGAVVIDVGITVVEDPGSKPKILGDVEFEKARERASYITPVPGGVGPVTVAMLMRNTLQCAVLCKQRKLELEQANTMTED